MLQKALITVGASLTAVVFLLFMIQRKKPRPDVRKSLEGQANNNESANTTKAETNRSIKSDSNERASETVTVAPNGVVVRTVSSCKDEEDSSDQMRGEDLDFPVQKFTETPSVELICQPESLVQPEPSNTLVAEPAFNEQTTPPELDRDVSAGQQTPTTDERVHQLPVEQDGVTSSGLIDECPEEQQTLADGCTKDQQSMNLGKRVGRCNIHQDILLFEDPADELQKKHPAEVQNTSEVLDEPSDISKSSVSEESSNEQLKPEDKKLLSPTKSDPLKPNQSMDVSKLPEDEQKCFDTEEDDNNDADGEEVKLLLTQATNSKPSSSKESVEIVGEEQSISQSPSTANSQNLSLQARPEESNGGPVQESSQSELEQSNDESLKESQSESEQSNGEPLKQPSQSELEQSNCEPLKEHSQSETAHSNGEPLKESSQSELEQSNCEPLKEPSQSETAQSNGKPLKEYSQSESELSSNAESIKKTSHSESESSNGVSVKKVSNFELVQSNGDSIKDSTDAAVEKSNEGSNELASVSEHYYDNHKAMLSIKPSNSSRRGDYRKLWPQPEDGLVFVKGSAGQPLVPQYLRDMDYLSNRSIPIHDPATTDLLYTNMNKLVHPPENWVRVISVSKNLELRVRHDERDMLLEQLERKGVCDPLSKPPPPRLLIVGSLVAAQLEVPRRGLIWCRVHITAVVPVTGPSGRRKGRQPQPQHQPQPLFMVESVDHFPAASAEPVRASDLRPLAAHAMNAPFFDQMFYLLNTMPTDAVEFGSGARDVLLEQLRAGQNFLRVTGPAACTVISGTCYWMASLAAVQTSENDSAVCLLEEKLQKSEHAMPIYTGRVLNGLHFNKCIFRDGEAFWSDDERCPSSLETSYGPPNPQQEYLWLRRTDSRIIQAFRGFKLPYKHAKYQFKCLGFNMSLHEYYTVYRHHSSTVLLTADPDKVLKVVLDDPQAVVILDFHMQTLIRFYHFDPNLITDPEAHVAKDNTPMNMLSFPKDDNGFLVFGNTFFSDFTKENLRIPVMPF